MHTTIDSCDISNPDIYTEVNIILPNQCPHCKTGIEAKYLSAHHISASSLAEINVLFFCPKCERCFVGIYGMDFSKRYENKTSPAKIDYLFPNSEAKTIFSDNIILLSPSFVQIYNQAEKAENAGLKDICGLGYRKALEFLVKDYACAFHPDDIEQIKSKMLSKCIDDYIDHNRIKSLAKASAWIGNDETHYVKKHDDYNVQHMKAFVTALVNYVDSELSYICCDIVKL